MEIKCCRKLEAASLRISSWTDSVFILHGASWVEISLERNIHSRTEGEAGGLVILSSLLAVGAFNKHPKGI